MRSLWNNRDAASFLKKYRGVGADLALRTYSSRLIGADTRLVLHGGGNTSVKTSMALITGETVEVLCIKGSGWDLATIEPQGHPAVKLDALRSLRNLDNLSDEDMVNFLRTHLLDATAPNPSIETLLHAFLPHKFVDHTHADAVLAVIDQPNPEKSARAWCGNALALVPYIKPGFDLAKLAGRIYDRDPGVEGLVLLNHGIITFGETAPESYERMIRWVTRAERFIANRKRHRFTPVVRLSAPADAASVIAPLIRRFCAVADSAGNLSPVIVRRRAGKSILQFVNSREVKRLSQLGPPTPDHIIRTKLKPLIAPPYIAGEEKAFAATLEKIFRDYENDYRAYFSRHRKHAVAPLTMLDAKPRVVIVPGCGLFASAITAKDADIILDLYAHAIAVMRDAMRVGRYRVLPEKDLFDIEYWSLEQAKLGKGKPSCLDGHVTWISGAASGIGLATAQIFAANGAHVFLTDIDANGLKVALATFGDKSLVAGEPCDVTSRHAIRESFAACCRTFGGVDIVISNAGTAPTGNIAAIPDKTITASFAINYFSHHYVAQTAMAIFTRQNHGGTLLFNASKGAFNPGPGLGPYNIPKAGVIALMRQCAVEFGKAGVRVNAVNADRVRTNLYRDGLLEKRAKARGVSVTAYLAGNLLGKEVTAIDVAQGFLALAQCRKTTGAVLTVDGGNAAAFPR